MCADRMRIGTFLRHKTIATHVAHLISFFTHADMDMVLHLTSGVLLAAGEDPTHKIL